MADDLDSDRQNLRRQANQPFDEVFDAGDDESVPSINSPPPPRPTGIGGRRGRSRGDTPPEARMSADNTDDEFGQQNDIPGRSGRPEPRSYQDDDDNSEDDDVEFGGGGRPPAQQAGRGKAGAGAQQQQQAEKDMYGEEEGDDTDSDEDEDEDEEESGAVEGSSRGSSRVSGRKKPGRISRNPSTSPADDFKPSKPNRGRPGKTTPRAYDPADYDHLAVTPEIKELFQYITRYTPQNLELDYHFKPFIPDYIPSIGDVDAFLKIPRPDGKPDTLGLSVLDEPCAKQSDPTVLDLQLRAVSKQTNLKPQSVKSIEQAEKNPKAIDNWINSITDLHKHKPPPNVHYTKNMPDIDSLMQEWPAEFEELLKEVDLPSADLDCDLPTYIDMICSLLDIPIYKSKVQSLHVLFTLFSEFKNSQHFRTLANDHQLDNALKDNVANDEDRLVL